jgi:hypothetical protein
MKRAMRVFDGIMEFTEAFIRVGLIVAIITMAAPVGFH